jgi:hypothetical protein
MDEQQEGNSNDVAIAPEFRCDICGATGNTKGVAFRTRRDLLTHRSLAHRDAAPRAESAPNGSGGHTARASEPAHVKFCPQCGCNLEVVNAALAFVSQRGGIK